MITLITGYAGTAKSTKLQEFKIQNSLLITNFNDLLQKMDFKSFGVNLKTYTMKQKYFNMGIGLKNFKKQFEVFLGKNNIDLVLFDNMEVFPAGIARMILDVSKDSVCVFDKGFDITAITKHHLFKKTLEFDSIIELNKTYIGKVIMQLALDILGIDKNSITYSKKKGRIVKNINLSPKKLEVFMVNNTINDLLDDTNIIQRFDSVLFILTSIFRVLATTTPTDYPYTSQELKSLIYKVITRATNKISITYDDTFCHFSTKPPKEYCDILTPLKNHIEFENTFSVFKTDTDNDDEYADFPDFPLVNDGEDMPF